MGRAEYEEAVARLLAAQQQVIDLKAEIDREQQASLGFRQLGEKALAAKTAEEFFPLIAEEVLTAFGTENALLIRFSPGGAEICGSCCADDVSPSEVIAFEEIARKAIRSGVLVASGKDLPPLRGKATSVLMVGSFPCTVEPQAFYSIIATVSQAKAPFYPKFGKEVAALFSAYLDHVAILQRHLRDRENSTRMLQAMQNFVPKEFLQALGHADVTTARLGDATLRRMNILFTDIRNFTGTTESMAPADAAAFLNSCLSRMGPLVRAHGGFIDKYFGDGIVALFPGSPEEAVTAGLAMQAELSSGIHDKPVGLGVGIQSGDVMLCTVGEVERFDVTVISDAVNVASRLESLTKTVGCSMLVSGEVAAQLKGGLKTHTRLLGPFALKGKALVVDLYEVFAADPPEMLKIKLASCAALRQANQLCQEGREEEAVAILRARSDQAPRDQPLKWWVDFLSARLATRLQPTVTVAA